MPDPNFNPNVPFHRFGAEMARVTHFRQTWWRDQVTCAESRGDNENSITLLINW